MRSISNISVFLQDVNNILQTQFIPEIPVRITCSEKERKLLSLSLPPKLGGFGIRILTSIQILNLTTHLFSTQSVKRANRTDENIHHQFRGIKAG